MLPFKSRKSFLLLTKVPVLLALAGVVASSLGVVVTPQPPRDHSQRYPCESGHCGCGSAQQCWRSCCCHDDAAKLAWAAKHQVEPPSFLVERVQTTLIALAEKPSNCCKLQPKETGTSSCATKSEDAIPIGITLLSQANQCRGLAHYVAVGGIAICAPQPELEHFLQRTQWVTLFDPPLCSISSDPPTPPPRIAV